MELKEMNGKTFAKMNKIMESRFGFSIDPTTLTHQKARKIVDAINEALSKISRSTDRHNAMNDPKYSEMVMVKESMNQFMKDYKPANAPMQKTSPKLKEIKNKVTKEGAIAEMVKSKEFRLVERAVELSKKRDTVPSKYVSAFAPMMDLLRETTVVTEGEVDKSEVILAANNMVDKMQDMIEDISRMVNEELPPLSDSIRDEIGSAEAAAFTGSATDALNSLLDTVKTSREALSNAAITLGGGEATPMPMPGDSELDTDLDTDLDMSSDMDVEGGEDEFAAFDSAVGTDETGRAER